MTGLTAIALQETVDFSLQMPGNAALFAVLCAIALHSAAAPSAKKSLDEAFRTLFRMTTCPRCNSGRFRRSASRSWWEGWRKTLTGRRPYRCDACDGAGGASSPVNTPRRAARRRYRSRRNMKGAGLPADEWSRLDLNALDRPANPPPSDHRP